MRPRVTAASQAASAASQRGHRDRGGDGSCDGKKDITYERANIAGFTLLFKDKETERKWRYYCLSKQTQMTGRFLFMAGMYQALFLMADINDNNNSTFFKGCWRLGCGLSCLTLCFLVATSLIYPSQIMLFYLQLLYGGLSLFLHFLGRDRLGTWDFLILVYGLCFFMLPKISPLNFLHSFMGSAILCAGYVYISAFWLQMSQWMLSTVFLLVVAVLFMYISYSSEKSSRERWLLRQRLNREHIDLQMVASSIQGDMAAAAQYRHSGTGSGIGNVGQHRSSSDHGVSGDALPSTSVAAAAAAVLPPGQTERMNNFFKGIAAWAICMSMGYAFQTLGEDAETEGVPPQGRSNSKAFALLMHSMGFSIFLLYFTGQMRWFLINGVVGMLMLWVFNETGLDNRWAVISTHSIGYFILALVVVSSILVFGGVVLVWSHLIEFLMNILTRYPEVKDEIRQERLLEQVLVRYLADMPQTTVLQRPADYLDEEAAIDNTHEDYFIEADSGAQFYGGGHLHRRCHSSSSIRPDDTVQSIRALSPPKAEVAPRKLSRVLEAKKPNVCFFCSKHEPVYLLPACTGWTPRDRSNSGTLAMCTPYSELAHTRDAMNIRLLDMSKAAQAASEENAVLCDRLEATVQELGKVRIEHEETVQTLKSQLEDVSQRLEMEARRREKDMEQIISQHNTQLSEVKRLYKKLQHRQREFLVQHQAGVSEPPVVSSNVNSSSNLSTLAPEFKPASTAVVVTSAQTALTTITNNGNKQSSRKQQNSSDNSSEIIQESRLPVNAEPNTLFASSDLQRDFDKLWLESFEEIQNLLSSSSHTDVWRREGGVDADSGRMKYAMNLTDDAGL